MSIESDIIACLESRNGETDLLTILGTLTHYSQGSVQVALSAMVKAGTHICRPRKAVYAIIKQDDSKPELWQMTSATKTARIVALLKARGPLKSSAIHRACPDIKQLEAVLFDMCQAGHVHSQGDHVWAVGRNPRQRNIATPPVMSHGMRHPEERRSPVTAIPSEASETREASAEATSETPSETRAAASVADVLDESAVGQEPAPEIGPALAAADLAAPKYEPHPDDAELHIVIEPRDSNRAPPTEIVRVADWNYAWGASTHQHPETAMSQEPAAETNDNDKAPATLPAPAATFHMEMPGLHIAISGEAKAVMEAVSAIEQTIGAQ